MTVNPYEILGIEPDATEDEISQAYKDKAKQAHPDHGGSTEEFVRVKQASMVLLDPDKRSQFDRDGVIDENKPDIVFSSAMERVAAFFINSINATIDHPVNLEQLDLVQGATQFFNQEINNQRYNVSTMQRRIAQFEKALTRLKTKRQNDVLRQMILSHVIGLKTAVVANQREIKIYETAKEIVADYEFGADSVSNPYKLVHRIFT